MNAVSVKFNAHKLQQDYAIAHSLDESAENIESAKGRIAMRTAHLKNAGFQVFADEHDVMLLAV